jgi:peptide/nickel transport system substrate-binding protein
MKRDIFLLWVIGVMTTLMFFSSGAGTSSAQEKPQYGGTLIFAVGEEPPSYDAHRETSFTVLHPARPHYSLLLNFDPENYPKVAGELAESWTISKDDKTYTFKIRKGVRFHDGSTLTAKDIKASYDKIIFPPAGIMSIRKAFYSAVEKVDTPDDYTVVFRLKHPSASFLTALASPFNFIYKADILAKDMRWYEKNIMGSGPFKFVEYVAGSHWAGKRNEDYFMKGRPYLDGYRAVYIKDTGARVAAVRSGRVMAEFRFFGPNQRDDVVQAMGDKIRVQEISNTFVMAIFINCEKKPFDDPRVRRALTLALDRWEGSRQLRKISNMKEVGGILRPGSEYAISEAGLVQLAGYSKDIEASRKEARRLLKEAGIPEGFSFELKNRPPAKDYETAGVWMIDQWRKIGLNVRQKTQELGKAYKDLQSGDYEVGMFGFSDYVDDPDLQLIRYVSDEKGSANYGHYNDPVLDDLYSKQSKAMNPVEREKLIRQFEKRVLDEKAYVALVPWMHRIVLHSPRVKGWRVLSSHFLNQDLTNVWLDKE